MLGMNQGQTHTRQAPSLYTTISQVSKEGTYFGKNKVGHDHKAYAQALP